MHYWPYLEFSGFPNLINLQNSLLNKNLKFSAKTLSNCEAYFFGKMAFHLCNFLSIQTLFYVVYFCMETRQMVDVLWVPPGPSPSNLAEVQTPTHTFISSTRSENQVSPMGAKNIWRKTSAKSPYDISISSCMQSKSGQN